MKKQRVFYPLLILSQFMFTSFTCAEAYLEKICEAPLNPQLLLDLTAENKTPKHANISPLSFEQLARQTITQDLTGDWKIENMLTDITNYGQKFLVRYDLKHPLFNKTLQLEKSYLILGQYQDNFIAVASSRKSEYDHNNYVTDTNVTIGLYQLEDNQLTCHRPLFKSKYSYWDSFKDARIKEGILFFTDHFVPINQFYQDYTGEVFPKHNPTFDYSHHLSVEYSIDLKDSTANLKVEKLYPNLNITHQADGRRTIDKRIQLQIPTDVLNAELTLFHENCENIFYMTCAKHLEGAEYLSGNEIKAMMDEVQSSIQTLGLGKRESK